MTRAQPIDTLLEMLVLTLRGGDSPERISYSALRGALRQAVNRAMNAGIPKDEAEFVRANPGGETLLIVYYRSDEDDFTAAYAFRGNQLVHSYEN